MELTAKQEQFVREYLVDLNATQAALRAHYSRRSAKQLGERNLRNPEVAQAIEKGMNERAERTGINQDRVLQGLLKEAENAGSDAARVSAWAWLGKHLGMFTEKTEIVGGMPIRLLTRIPDEDDD